MIGKGKPLRIAAVLTEYRPWSHADVLIGKFIQGLKLDLTPSWTPIPVRAMYVDGFKATCLMLNGLAKQFLFAAQLAGDTGPVSTQFWLQEPTFGHFDYLANAIMSMVRTGRSPYPVERTALTTGILSTAMDSRFEKYRRIETPDLHLAYQAVDYNLGAYRHPRASNGRSGGWNFILQRNMELITRGTQRPLRSSRCQLPSSLTLLRRPPPECQVFPTKCIRGLWSQAALVADLVGRAGLESSSPLAWFLSAFVVPSPVPELPEVEVLVRYLQRVLPGRKVRGVTVLRPRVVRPDEANTLAKA